MRFIALIILLAGFPLFSQQYYRSNSLAMELERIPQLDTSPLDYDGWLLELRKRDNLHEYALYNKGELKKSFIKEYNSSGYLIYSSESRSGKLREEVQFRSDGQIGEEIFYDEKGDFVEKKSYQYSDQGELTGVEIRDSEEEVSALAYSIRPDGSLRSISGGIESGKNSFSGTLYMENRTDGPVRIISYHRGTGRLESLIRFENDEKVLKETRTYGSDGILSTIVIDDLINNQITTQVMNNDGQIVTEEILRDKELISGSYFRYNQGRLSQKETIAPGIRDKWVYNYAGQTLREEKFYRRDVLEHFIVYSDEEGKNYIKELYNDEEVIMKIHFENDKKIKEEFIEKGQIVRTRNFDN